MYDKKCQLLAFIKLIVGKNVSAKASRQWTTIIRVYGKKHQSMSIILSAIIDRVRWIRRERHTVNAKELLLKEVVEWTSFFYVQFYSVDSNCSKKRGQSLLVLLCSSVICSCGRLLHLVVVYLMISTREAHHMMLLQ